MLPQQKRQRFAKQQRNNAVGEVFAAAVVRRYRRLATFQRSQSSVPKKKGREIIPALRYPCKFKMRP
jgi:hypothetical protein